ncbi:MAG TPA: response regulator transcription factor [Candidatus Polarisedimenticolia bacterium]|nr:response regulator transcription factor [Candidatus Polarisedimenticolia bacterium]
MKILIAEDDPVSRRVLEATLVKWGFEVVLAPDGSHAWAALQAEGAPSLAVLDWMMPGLDGPEVCRRARQEEGTRATYIILLTAKGRREDLVAGLQAGANDYVTKPFDQDELRARVQVGVRMVELQRLLAARVVELEEALSRVKQLSGLLPICSYCKKVRDDKNYWQQVESYVGTHSEAQFSHSICPDCFESIVKPEIKKMSGRGAAGS